MDHAKEESERDLEFMLGQMEPNMQAIGAKIQCMAKVENTIQTGGLNIAGLFTKEYTMGMDLTSLKIEHNIVEFSEKENLSAVGDSAIRKEHP